MGRVVKEMEIVLMEKESTIARMKMLVSDLQGKWRSDTVKQEALRKKEREKVH